MNENWLKLCCKCTELQLKGTLNGGQSFRWRNFVKDTREEWVGVFQDKLWILQQNKDNIMYKVIEPSLQEARSELGETNSKKYKPDPSIYKKMLSDYFQLEYKLEEYYPKWSKKDPYFEEAAKQFYGIRILKQDLTENIFSFICSSNNNISRISSMVEKLTKFYGKIICEYNGVTYYTFPTAEDLAQEGVEEKLRENGFGYRAKYIHQSAKIITNEGGKTWLGKLELMSYEDAKKSLMTLVGVGAKVADCICLMSLGHLQAIPVDTHIYQIAQRFYMPKLAKQKTVTEKVYNEIGEFFRNMYGPLAGWAHTVLFCADLKKFQDEKRKKK